MNPHRRYKSYMQASDLLLITLPIILVLFAVFGLNPFHRKNIDKPKPIDGQTITSNALSGNVESIHPWGRTEVVPMKSVELEYFEYCDEWVMSGDVEQPIGRKDYFMPVMKGHLDLNVKSLTQTWLEYGAYETGSIDDPKTYEDFRVAHIKVEDKRVTNILYKHYRLDSDKTWSIIAVWEAKFEK